MNTHASKPVLVLAVGNPSRGDDALGPLLLEKLESGLPALDSIELLTDFQLQIEHAMDLQNRSLVLFVDASVAVEQAFSLEALSPERDDSFTSHAMTPAAVLAVYQMVYHEPPPPSFLLSIRGEAFELGAELSALAVGYLEEAYQFSLQFLTQETEHKPILAEALMEGKY
ncbi:hydrogenase maturation protease [Methylocucumis oryzae]|uniref:Ni/Fe hydrogenase n=1 Tax=Methylocucumis oryzae TaxID=1632867 RepID=A0A0F3IGH6_9GAMM|nr:hydrogenase maturation protease [Methylocucumis oryzae]KJV05905.1 Ni/Fe hydrogenase [Methylocucumis oryzae]